MKNDIISIVRITIYVAFIISAMMIILIFIMDFLVSPIPRELLLEPYLRDWCGILSRCASRTQGSFIEHIQSGALWKNWDLAATENRLKKASLLGSVIGVGYVAIAAFRRQR